jgi:D-cysteine desulfhydrase
MPLPIVERYPQLATLSHVALGTLPTPIDRVGLDAPGLPELLFKRDDLTSGLYGGNKVRKLEFLLGTALAENRRAVVTFGAYGSNHALATAVHARALGLEPHVVLSPQAPGPFAAATLRAHAKLGTVIHPVDGWDGAREAVAAKQQLAQRDGIEPAVIPMGGTSALGATGYVNAAFEILDQAASDPSLAPDVVYLAGGTLGTAVGLALGFAAAGAATRVVAVRVTPGEVANDAFAEKIAAETAALLHDADLSFPKLALADLAFEMRHDWFEPGYGVVTPATTLAVVTAKNSGIKLETTYTGKAFAALLQDAADGLLGDQRVMFIDTYNSAPMPEPGPVELLPQVLQDYVATCDELFALAPNDSTEGN